MARVVVWEFISPGGTMQAPDGEPARRHTGWVTRFPGPEQFKRRADAVLARESPMI